MRNLVRAFTVLSCDCSRSTFINTDSAANMHGGPQICWTPWIDFKTDESGTSTSRRGEQRCAAPGRPHLGLDAGIEGLLGDGGGAGHVLVRAVGAAADEARRQLAGPPVLLDRVRELRGGRRNGTVRRCPKAIILYTFTSVGAIRCWTFNLGQLRSQKWLSWFPL